MHMCRVPQKTECQRSSASAYVAVRRFPSACCITLMTLLGYQVWAWSQLPATGVDREDLAV